MVREGSALKGTVYGILFTIPFWALIVWGVWSWLH
jgi:hypothetical protein